MSRSELIIKICELYPNIPRKQMDLLIKSIFSSMVDYLVKGNRIEIRGFGSFSIKKRKTSMITNPRLGKVSGRKEIRGVVYFRAGKALKVLVNNHK